MRTRDAQLSLLLANGPELPTDPTELPVPRSASQVQSPAAPAESRQRKAPSQVGSGPKVPLPQYTKGSWIQSPCSVMNSDTAFTYLRVFEFHAHRRGRTSGANEQLPGIKTSIYSPLQPKADTRSRLGVHRGTGRCCIALKAPYCTASSSSLAPSYQPASDPGLVLR